jgi:predicted nucleic acid-binding protein
MKALAGFRRVFCDSGFLIALYAPGDHYHQRAKRLLVGAAERRLPLLTSWPVVSESLTLLRRHYGWSSAEALAGDLYAYRTLQPDVRALEIALGEYRRRSRETVISFVDVLSFILIRDAGAGTIVFGFDRDLARLGLTVFA